MTAAHESRVEALKEAAVLRSLAEQVASPVVAGRKSRKALSANQRWQWTKITNRVVDDSRNYAEWITSDEKQIAESWRKQCKAIGIGAGLFGWLVWNWAFPLLIELAKLWIESRNQGRISDR